MTDPVRQAAAVQRLALDQADEVWPGCEEVEVVGNRARENGLVVFVAGQGPRSAGPDRVAHLGEGALQYGLIELLLGAKEVARRATRDTGGGADLIQAGGLIPLLGEEALRRIQDGGAGTLRVSNTLGCGCQSPLAQRVAACLLISKL